MNDYFSNFHTVPPQGFLRTFFLSLRISQSNKICRVCFCCNLCEVDSHIDCTSWVVYKHATRGSSKQFMYYGVYGVLGV